MTTLTDAGPDVRVDVLGVHVSAIDELDALRQISRWIQGQQAQYVCVTGVHGVMESRHDPELRAIHNRSALTTPDGMPLVWAGRRAGAENICRVYGPDLMLSVLARAAEHGWRSFLYGGAPGVADELADRMRRRFPGLAIAGTWSPPYRELDADEDQAIVDEINAARPDVVWVGLSTPKQERWMASHVDRIPGAVLIGVGAAFDFHTGRVRQAPRWMQASGLEWAFRLGCEPRRLWRRYLGNNPRFVAAILRQPPALVSPPADDRAEAVR